jgi:hypothetical protein
MLLTINGVPQAQPADLIKSFDSLQTSPDIANRIAEITQLRNNFYAKLGQLTTKPLNEVISEIDWLPLMSYLNAGPDMLQMGVKNANYPFILNFQPFTSANKVVSANNGKKPL